MFPSDFWKRAVGGLIPYLWPPVYSSQLLLIWLLHFLPHWPDALQSHLGPCGCQCLFSALILLGLSAVQMAWTTPATWISALSRSLPSLSLCIPCDLFFIPCLSDTGKCRQSSTIYSWIPCVFLYFSIFTRILASHHGQQFRSPSYLSDPVLRALYV